MTITQSNNSSSSSSSSPAGCDGIDNVSQSRRSTKTKEEIISKARYHVIHSNSDGTATTTTTTTSIKILQLQGTPYEMGFQHGYLLSAAIDTMLNETMMTALPSFLCTLIPGLSREEAVALMWEGQRAAEPFWPADGREEMRGMADGATHAGAQYATRKNVLLWNTYYDQWVLYCHPHFSWPSSSSSMSSTTKLRPIISSMMNKRGAKHGSLVGSVGCSSFSAWGDWADDGSSNPGDGGGGRLIFGKNEDNFNMPHQLDHRILVVAKPDQGHGQTFCTFPGLIGLDGGMNQKGLQIMTQLNSMKDETMEGCGIGVLTRQILSRCQTIPEAIALLEQTPLCGGIAWHIADGNAGQAVIVETSSTRVCVRYPLNSDKALWQSNHSNCYPGWEGYEGYNMVQDQQLVNELENVDTIQDWQTSLRDPTNIYVQAPSRFERYRELLKEYRGKISVETAIRILSDRYDPYTRRTREKNDASPTNNVGCTICALYPNVRFGTASSSQKERDSTNEENYEARISNLWSMVSYPETGDFWLAIQSFPAQYGGYQHFNLHDLLDEY